MVNSGVFPIPTARGGTENHVYCLTRQLLADGVDVDLVSDLSADAECDYLGTVRPVNLREAGAFGLGFLGYSLRHLVGGMAAFVSAARQMDEDYDLIHCHGRVAPLCLSLYSKLPVVSTLHDDPPPPQLSRHAIYNLNERFVLRNLARWSTHLIGLHEGTKSWLLGMGIPEERISIVPNGVDTDLFQSSGKPKGSFCLFVGSLVKRKGTDLLLEALSQVDTLECHIVGSGPEGSFLRKKSRELELDGRVQFLGRVPLQELIDQYTRAQFLVLPSYAEGMPLTVLEAMSCGSPVVAADTPGTREVVLHNETGLLVQPGNVTPLADALTQLAGDPQRARLFGRRARQLVEEGFTWQTVAGKVLAVYNKIGAM